MGMGKGGGGRSGKKGEVGKRGKGEKEEGEASILKKHRSQTEGFLMTEAGII